jgi:aspartate carbamoyltransferase regulatory subunit
LEKAETLAGEFDLNIAPYKNDTFAFTTEELNAIEDLKIDLKRRLDLPATKNDIVRCGIHSIIEDYRQRGAESLIVQRIRKKKPR